MAGIQLSRCRREEKSPHISVNKQGSKSTPSGYLFFGRKSPSIYPDIYTPKSQGNFEYFSKFLSLIRKWGGVKVNHGSEKIFIPSLITNFRPQFVNPGRWNFRYLIVWRRTLLYIRTFEGVKVNPSPKVFWKTPSLIPTFEGRFVNPEAITFLLSSYISGHLGPRNHSLCRYYFGGDACGHHLRVARITV